jgi:hypothetical protein
MNSENSSSVFRDKKEEDMKWIWGRERIVINERHDLVGERTLSIFSLFDGEELGPLLAGYDFLLIPSLGR